MSDFNPMTIVAAAELLAESHTHADFNVLAIQCGISDRPEDRVYRRGLRLSLKLRLKKMSTSTPKLAWSPLVEPSLT